MSENVIYGHIEGQYRGEPDKIMNPPIYKKDDYYWIRSDDRKDQQVLQLIETENKITENKMNNYKTTENTIYEEIKSRMVDNEIEYPYKFYDTNYELYTKYVENKGHPIYCRQNTKSSKIDILLDVNDLVNKQNLVNKPDQSNCDVINVTTNMQCNICSYAVDNNGDELYDLILFDIETGEKIFHKIPPLMYGDYLWSNNGKLIYYIGHDEANRMCKLYVYQFDNHVSTLLYEEYDNLFSTNIYYSSNCKYLFIDTSSTETSEMYYIDTEIDPYKLHIIRPREYNIKYTIDDYNDKYFIVRSNIDNCINFAIFLTSKTNSRVFVPFMKYNPKMYITDITSFENFIVVEARINGFTKIGYFHKNTISPLINFCNFDDSIYTIKLSNKYNLNYKTDEIILYYDSMITPNKLVKYNINTNNIQVLKEDVVPNYDKSLYDTKVIYCKSHDNKDIPISMVYRKDLYKNTLDPQPLYLYGYGAYGACIDPCYNQMICSLLDRGFIYCIAHVRGSSTKGYDWYVDGKMKNKMNSFYDFNTVAEYLIKQNYTNSNMLIAEGRSAGGLLMGGILTIKPELYKTIILGVPFLDVLATMSDPTIPLTVPEWEEWGNPNIKEYFEYMSKYSPIDNIKQIEYPNTLITCGLHDPRVQYWEPLKFHMKLKDNNIDNNLHLIKIDTKGHFSNSDRFLSARECAFKYSFILHTL